MAEELQVPTHLTLENADTPRALALAAGQVVPLEEARIMASVPPPDTAPREATG
jgi:hypothetical protein